MVGSKNERTGLSSEAQGDTYQEPNGMCSSSADTQRGGIIYAPERGKVVLHPGLYPQSFTDAGRHTEATHQCKVGCLALQKLVVHRVANRPGSRFYEGQDGAG